MAASSCSRGSSRSPISSSTTDDPSRAKPCASSHPIGPPPSTTRRPGSSPMSQTSSEVSGSTCARPGTSGTRGADPVAISAWRNCTGWPSTSARPAPVKRAWPCATDTPASRSRSGESTGSMCAIAARTWSITAPKSTRTPSVCTPSAAEPRATDAACAADSRDLLGTQPVHRQSPPVRSRSTSSARGPQRGRRVRGREPGGAAAEDEQVPRVARAGRQRVRAAVHVANLAPRSVRARPRSRPLARAQGATSESA